jgi:hypothetical protein
MEMSLSLTLTNKIKLKEQMISKSSKKMVRKLKEEGQEKKAFHQLINHIWLTVKINNKIIQNFLIINMKNAQKII